mgnify:CR=1 FL=1
MVCTNIPIEVMETKCCGSIICADCGKKLTKCPIRCETTKFKLKVNKFLQWKVNDLPAECEFCEKQYPIWEILEHKKKCEMNIYKEVIFNEFLHTCPLYKTTMMNAWCCDGWRIKNNGCVKNGIDDVTV